MSPHTSKDAVPLVAMSTFFPVRPHDKKPGFPSHRLVLEHPGRSEESFSWFTENFCHFYPSDLFRALLTFWAFNLVYSPIRGIRPCSDLASPCILTMCLVILSVLVGVLFLLHRTLKVNPASSTQAVLGPPPCSTVYPPLTLPGWSVLYSFLVSLLLLSLTPFPTANSRSSNRSLLLFFFCSRSLRQPGCMIFFPPFPLACHLLWVC